MWDLTDVWSRTFCSQFQSACCLFCIKNQKSFVVCKTVVRLTCYNKCIHMHHDKVRNLDFLLLLLPLAFFPHLHSEDFLKLQILCVCVECLRYAVMSQLYQPSWFVFYSDSWHRFNRPCRGIIFYFLTFLWIPTNGCGDTRGKTNCKSSECSSLVSGVSSG